MRPSLESEELGFILEEAVRANLGIMTFTAPRIVCLIRKYAANIPARNRRRIIKLIDLWLEGTHIANDGAEEWDKLSKYLKMLTGDC